MRGVKMYKVIFATVGTVLRMMFRFVFHWRIIGLENIPPGGAVLAPNHQSFWDIPLIALAVPRRVHFMAKEELFHVPVFGAIIRSLLAFPVKRGMPDRAAIRHAIGLLQSGELVVIFPEGTRTKTGELGKAEAGISLIVSKADTPVVPVGIVGTFRIFRRIATMPCISIEFGCPILPHKPAQPDKQSKSDLGEQVMRGIAELLRPNSEKPVREKSEK